MNIRLLLIDTSLGKGVAVKQALEETGQFQVHPFADAYAALEFQQDSPADIAIVDMHMPEYPGPELVKAVLDLSVDTILIACSTDSQAAAQAVMLGAAGLITPNYNAREVLQRIRNIAPHLFGAAASEVAAASQDDNSTDVDPRSTAAFAKLAAEEPPLPGFRQGGTITQYMRQLTDTDKDQLILAINNLMEADSDDIDAGLNAGWEDVDVPADAEEDTPAQFILEDVVEDTVPMEADKFQHYVKKIRDEGDKMRYVREPNFLDDNVVFETDPFDQTTRPSQSERARMEQDQSDPETLEWLPPEGVSQATEERTHPYEPEQIRPEDDPIVAQSDPMRDAWDWGDIEKPQPAHRDPRMAQMAVTLTHASLDSTAQAILLLDGEELVASEGQLTDEAISEIVTSITGNPEDILAKRARIHFVTLEANGLDYLIYSRRTADDYVLSMVFEGTTSMTDIRRQARALLGALESVPEVPPEDYEVDGADSKDDSQPTKGGLRLQSSDSAGTAHITPALPIATMPMIRYTFVWLPRDPNFTIEYATAEAINAGLRVQLVERGWQVEVLEVEEDYVYIVAGVPGEEPPNSIVRNLQRRAAQIAKIQAPYVDLDTLWAESYFVLTPGRELNPQEIQQYVNFYRI